MAERPSSMYSEPGFESRSKALNRARGLKSSFQPSKRSNARSAESSDAESTLSSEGSEQWETWGTSSEYGVGTNRRLGFSANPSLTDVSNFLSTRPKSDDDSDITVVDPENCCYNSMDEDTYGWDAEWGRKPEPQDGSVSRRKNRSASPDSFWPVLTNGRKNGLLQLVFLNRSANSSKSNII